MSQSRQSTPSLHDVIDVALEASAVHVEESALRRSARLEGGSKLRIYLPFFRFFLTSFESVATSMFERTGKLRVGRTPTGWLEVHVGDDLEKGLRLLTEIVHTLPGLDSSRFVDLRYMRVSRYPPSDVRTMLNDDHPAASLARAARLFKIDQSAHVLTTASAGAHADVVPLLRSLFGIVTRWTAPYQFPYSNTPSYKF